MCNCFSKNLRLGEAAELAAATTSTGINGWLKIPTKNNVDIILQWGRVTVTASLVSTTMFDGSTTFNYPIAFPTAAISGLATPLDSSETSIETATAFAGRTSASVRIGGASIKTNPTGTLEMAASFLAIGY